jgi:hypothetical protein
MLPAGFKVNGQVAGGIPPQVEKIVRLLGGFPSGELVTSTELSARLHIAKCGTTLGPPALTEYREKVDNKVYWGSQTTISDLRKQLAEDTNEES